MVTSTTFGTGEFGRGKTLLALIVVIGCFAVLWPKIFYPMLTSSLFPGYSDGDSGDLCCDVIFEKDTNAYKLMNELCTSIIRKEGFKPKVPSSPTVKLMVHHPPKNKWYKNYTGPEDTGKAEAPLTTSDLCRNEILITCKVDVLVLLNENPTMSKEYRESLVQLRSFNVSSCLKQNYGVHLEGIGLPKRFKVPESSPRHMRPERPIHMPQTIHPALREKGNAIPHPQRKTMDVEARNHGAQPGLRPPPMAGLNAPPPPRGGGGTMGVIMPLYTIGIVCFFLYTIFKIVFRKPEEIVPVKDRMRQLSVDSEHRKYNDEYENGSNRDPYYRTVDYGIRRRSSAGIAPIPIVAVVQDISVPRQIAPVAVTPPTKDREIIIENGTGPKERDAIVAAVKGILADVDKSLASSKRIGQLEEKEQEVKPTLEEEIEPDLKVVPITEEPMTLELPKTTLQLKEPEHLRRKGGQPKRPPTPIRMVESGTDESEEDEEDDQEKEQPMLHESCELIKFAQELSSLILKQGLASAAVMLAYANKKENVKGQTKSHAAESVAVVGMNESVGLECGEKWTDRSPTPTFPRLSSPLPPPRPPTPPVDVPNIYLEGPIPSPANQILISNSECEELDMDDDYDYEGDDDYDSENDKPVILSGKVTLSVLSGMGEDKTEAPSFSADEEVEKIAGQLNNAIKDIGRAEGPDTEEPNVSVPSVAQQSKGSSPDMDEYEVVGKDGLNGLQMEESDQTHYTTADAGEKPVNATGEETSADISVLEGLADEEEEEYDEEGEDEEAEDEEEEVENEEEAEEEEEEAEEEEDEDEEDEDEVQPTKTAPPKGTGNLPNKPSPLFSSKPPSPYAYGTFFTEP